MKRLCLCLIFIGLTITCATTKDTPISYQSGEQQNKLAALYAGVPNVKGYNQTRDYIITLRKPDQNLAQQTKTKGVVECLPLINEQAEVEFIYFRNTLHPMLDSAVTQAVKTARFKTYEEVTGKKSKYSLLLHFPFYPSKIDLSSLPKTDKNKPDSTQPDSARTGIDKPPLPVGGFGAIQKNLKYPKLARKTGLEGTVVIMCAIDNKGNVGEFNVVEPSNPLLIDAAIEAIRSVKWEPAEIQGKPTGTWISLPLKFRLK